MAKDKSTGKDKQRPIMTAAGEPLPIDPETGNIIADDLTEAQRAELEAAAAHITEALKPFIKKIVNYDISGLANHLVSEDTRQALKATINDLQAIQDLIDELEALQPYIDAELEKDGKTTDDYIRAYTPIELLELSRTPDSPIYKALEAARPAALIDNQNKGRADRRQLKAKAKDINAIMEIKGGAYPVFSKKELWDAFAPGRICKMGTLDPEYIDEKTGVIRKYPLEPGDVVPLDADEISITAFMLLNGIMANSVDNVREKFISNNGQLTFYVKGVLQAFTDDPRTLLDNQLNLDKKTAGVLYLENIFKPLQEYIGQTENGSRYSVFNYIGYDALSDTMTIQTPYIYQLWKSTQGAYFERKRLIEQARSNNKKPHKEDLKPLEINSLFKNKAYSVDESILEIAIYITNVLLTAGNTGREKKTEITYKKIISNCARLKQKLDEIGSRPNTETLPDGKKRNNTALYNTELRKIKRAFDVILDPELCDATEQFDFIDLQPAKINKAGKMELIAPTKKMINDKIVIRWQRKAAAEDL